MFSFKRNGYRGDGSGMAWPNSPNVNGVIKDVFGPRPFNAHIATVGYNYDFHRGIDIDVSGGAMLYAPINGAICRRHYSHFGWQYAAHLNEFALTSPSSSLAVSLGTNTLALTCSRVGATAFPSNIDMYQARERVGAKTNDWVTEIQFASTPNVTGAIGIGMFSANNSEYVALEYDGTVFTIRASGSNVQALNGTTYTSSSKSWLRITYTSASDVFDWLHSTDGSAWTTLATSATGRTFLTAGPAMIPTIYWRSADTNGIPYVLNVTMFNWQDSNQTIGRFGNWLQIISPMLKVVLVHFDRIDVPLGAFVSAGQALGIAGATGFDARSGRILAEHCHMECAATNAYSYANDEANNSLGSTLLPRTNVSNNVTCVRTTANDPDNVSSWLLAITCSRADSDFDLNTITLAGNITSRSINWNTRVGLNADNDIPKQSGVYMVPALFDQNSASYMISVFFNKSVVGNTFVSYVVSDTNGITLVNE